MLALVLLHESRRAARVSSDGDLVLLPDQDRALWDRDRIVEGSALVRQALGSGRIGPYAPQAAIAAVHAEAPLADETDWAQIVGLYDVLARADPSPVDRPDARSRPAPHTSGRWHWRDRSPSGASSSGGSPDCPVERGNRIEFAASMPIPPLRRRFGTPGIDHGQRRDEECAHTRTGDRR